MAGTTPAEPPADCPLCPRLVAFRQANAKTYPEFHNAPVDSFGDPAARLLIVGLAPGLKGANQTGRPFTGDYAGDLLYATLARFGYCEGTYAAHAGDGLALKDAMITNAVRCVPPQNKPTGPEINNCRPFLSARLAALPQLKVVLALGKIAHDSLIRACGLRLADYRFGHEAIHDLGNGLVLADSYHCSRYNVNTGRLTEAMFHDVFDHIDRVLGRT